MGDFNCGSGSHEMNWLLTRTPLREPVHGLHTFPSWRPARNIDHILVSPTLQVENVSVLNHAISDHLPIMMDVVPSASGAMCGECGRGWRKPPKCRPAQ